MKDIKEITAKDIMSGPPKAIGMSDTVNTAISTLRNENIYNLLVFENGKYAGIFGYKELVRLNTRPTETTKVTEYISRPPVLTEDTDIKAIAEKMYKLNHKIIPISSKETGKITGVVTETDVMKAIYDFSLLSGMMVRDFMTPNPITISHDETLGKAMTLLRENNVSRIPVKDADEKIKGIIEARKIIRDLALKEKYTTEAAGLIPHFFSPTTFEPEVISNLNIPVSSLMQTEHVIADPKDLIRDKIKETMNLGTTTITVKDLENRPIGIIAPKDIIQVISRPEFTPEETTQVQISGLDSMPPLEFFDKAEIHVILDRAVKKISAITTPQNFTVHMKAYRTDGKRMKYVFRTKFNAKGGEIITARNWGWDPIDTFAVLMDEAERRLIQKIQKRRDLTRRMMNDTKYHYEDEEAEEEE